MKNEEVWTEEKNNRRCDLIDKKYKLGHLAADEVYELKLLQEEMLQYQAKIAPLDIEGAEKLLKNIRELD